MYTSVESLILVGQAIIDSGISGGPSGQGLGLEGQGFARWRANGGHGMVLQVDEVGGYGSYEK